jgi:glycosyltransferase involved in cell wall biosynthesis
MNQLGLSIVTPVYKSERTILRALRSVSSAWTSLATDMQIPCEHVVVLDGRDLGSESIAEFFRPDSAIPLHIVHKAHSGVAASRNVGIGLAQYSHVTFLDADDEITADRLAHASRFLPNALIGLQSVVYDTKSRPPIGTRAQGLTGVQPNRYLMSLVAPTSTILELGGFREELKLGEDLDLVVRLRKLGVSIDFVSSIFTIRHVTGRNISLDYEGTKSGIFSLLRRFRNQ